MRFTVKGNELKSTFLDMGALLKRFERARVIGVQVNKSGITFTVDTGTYYMRTLDFVTQTDVVELNITILYADIVKFISGRTDATIELTSFYMQIFSNGASITLSSGESVPPKYVPKKGNVTALELSTLRNAVRVFSMTTDLQKAYKKDFSISFKGDRAILKSPTLWLETHSQGLNCVLSLVQLKGISMFQPTLIEVSDRIEFKKERAILSVPYTKPGTDAGIQQFKSGMKLVSAFSVVGIIKELQDIKSVVGVGSAAISVYATGFRIELSRNRITLSKRYGEEDFSHQLAQFNVMVDLFIMSLNILSDGDIVSVYMKEGLVCLENEVASILLSV